jgi:hypothetical protein
MWWFRVKPLFDIFRTLLQLLTTISYNPCNMMDVDPQQPQQYTILRIKRKRTDEPLDALGTSLKSRLPPPQVDMADISVVENRARKKRSPKGLNIFQFAQTVEHDAWEDEKRRRDLQVCRITYKMRL